MMTCQASGILTNICISIYNTIKAPHRHAVQGSPADSGDDAAHGCFFVRTTILLLTF